ncbi:MAG: HAD-IA family hydrolase [bacterium]|nr:HAD-IA family hydrolase [bacterium]
MIKALITDFSRVLLFPKDKSYSGSLNGLHRDLSIQPNYRLLDSFELNTQLLEYYKSLAGKLDLFVFTSESIQDSPELQPFIKPVFKEIFSAMKMEIDKKEESAYKKLVTAVNLDPAEIIYIDDSETNIDAAKKAGLQTILFKDNESLKTELQAKLVG